jgi:hypothetical protein
MKTTMMKQISRGIAAGLLLATPMLMARPHMMERTLGIEGKMGRHASEQSPVGWYMRTVATATLPDGKEFTHATAGVFGRLQDSKRKKDRHYIPAYGENSAILQVLFVQTKWGEDNGNYFSDYRRFKKHRHYRRSVWTFAVRNPRHVDLSQADLKIEVQGPYKVYRDTNGYREVLDPGYLHLTDRLHLVDVDNHRVYDYDELKNAQLSMDGKHTRTFRWVIGRVKKRDFRPVYKSE